MISHIENQLIRLKLKHRNIFRSGKCFLFCLNVKKFYYFKGSLIQNLGNPSYPWKIVATLNSSSNTNATIFKSSCTIVNGFGNFTGLGLSLNIGNFTISYNLLSPDSDNS